MYLGLPAMFCVRGGGNGRLDLLPSFNGGRRSCFSCPEVDGDATLVSEKKQYFQNFYQITFGYAPSR